MSNENIAFGAHSDETIVGIYHFFQPRPQDGSLPQYYLLHILDHRGFIDRELIARLLKEKFDKVVDLSNDLVGPFESLDELSIFAYDLASAIDSPKVSLLSVTDYNLLLENATDLNNFIYDLKNKGNILENIEKNQSKKAGFFSKIFKS